MEQQPYHVAHCTLFCAVLLSPLSLFRMPLRMTPTAGCVTMVEMCSVVTSVPECSTFNAQASLGHQREMRSGTALFVR